MDSVRGPGVILCNGQAWPATTELGVENRRTLGDSPGTNVLEQCVGKQVTWRASRPWNPTPRLRNSGSFPRLEIWGLPRPMLSHVTEIRAGADGKTVRQSYASNSCDRPYSAPYSGVSTAGTTSCTSFSDVVSLIMADFALK